MAVVIHGAALLLATFACGFDLRTRRIPNSLTFGSAAIALVVHMVIGGWTAAATAIGGMAIGVALLIVPYGLGGMGGGDVKLVGALGAWLGPGDAFWLAMYSGVAGAVMAAIVAIRHGYLRQAWRNVRLLLTHWRVMGVRPLPELTLSSGHGPRIAYAAPILVGTIVTLWLR